MVKQWLGMALVMGTLAALLAGLRLWQRRGTPHPELLRKLLHVGMGAVTLSFPWLFHEAWPIFVLGVLSVGGMLALRLVRGLRASLGCVVSGVSRTSFGEVYFPLAVAILFLLYLHNDHEEPNRRVLLYCVPILLLTVADALAALVGVRYGQAHYVTSDGSKTAEGSIAFSLSAFLCVHVPLLLATDIGRAEALLIALLLAWLAMMFEAVAWAGLDNLALPLVSYLLLKVYIDMPAAGLLARLAVTAGLTALLFLYCRRTTLIGSAVLGASLVGYVCWSLGGWAWLLPPLVLFLCYTLLSSRSEANRRRVHNVHAVACVSSAGLLWLFLFRIVNRPELEANFLFLFTLSFAAHLAIIGVARLRRDYPHRPAASLVALGALQGWLLIFLPYVLLEWLTPGTLRCSLCALPAVAVAAAGFYLTQPRIDDCPTDTPRWLRQAAHAGLGSAIGLVPLYLL